MREAPAAGAARGSARPGRPKIRGGSWGSAFRLAPKKEAAKYPKNTPKEAARYPKCPPNVEHFFIFLIE